MTHVTLSHQHAPNVDPLMIVNNEHKGNLKHKRTKKKHKKQQAIVSR